MQVVSGPFGREKVHFEGRTRAASKPKWLPSSNGSNDEDTDAVLRAAIAHLWFVTVHPFEDGNGRIARAIADLALARSEKQLSGLQHVGTDPVRT